jgi:xanthosine utilization system XapX-like protein
VTKFFDLYTIGSLILTFGVSMALSIALLFSYIDNRYIPLSPIFIIPCIISIIGIITIYIGEKYYD